MLSVCDSTKKKGTIHLQQQKCSGNICHRSEWYMYDVVNYWTTEE